MRPLHDDVPVLEQWWNDPEVGTLQHRVVRPEPASAFTGIVGWWSANTNGAGVGFTVTDHADTSVAGHATLFGASLPARFATLAFIVGPQHVGRSLGTDAVRVLARYGFGEMGLHRIELMVWAFNQRARRAYTEAGFVEEGTRRAAILRGGPRYRTVHPVSHNRGVLHHALAGRVVRGGRVWRTTPRTSSCGQGAESGRAPRPPTTLGHAPPKRASLRQHGSWLHPPASPHAWQHPCRGGRP